MLRHFQTRTLEDLRRPSLEVAFKKRTTELEILRSQQKSYLDIFVSVTYLYGSFLLVSVFCDCHVLEATSTQSPAVFLYRLLLTFC